MSDRSDAGDGGGSDVSEQRIAELEARIEELSDELAIPTTIAILEANVRALKALRGAIGLLRRTEERAPGERAGAAADHTGGLRDRTDSVAREAVAELDRAVSELAAAIEGEALPDNEEAKSVLAEIRAVRDDVADALETGGATDGLADRAAGADGSGDDADEEASPGRDDGGVEIDVESELESIKDEVRREDPYADGSSGDGDGSSGDGSGSSGSEGGSPGSGSGGGA